MFAAMTLQLQTQHSRVSACRRHPSDPVTGICASCLRERLSRFNPAGETSAVQTAELRRCKSLSAGKCGGPPSTEPRRRSCDVRPRQSLLHLFNLDDQENVVDGGAEVATKNLGLFHGAVFESTRGHESAIEKRKIRVSVPAGNDGIEAEAKTIKEYIDLELGLRGGKESRRDLRDIAGSLLAAASVFGKKLGKWKQNQKQKAKKKIPEIGCVGDDSSTEMMDKQLGIGSHGGFGRRSCDAARVSLDGSMCSFDEPRASWDGHSYGRSLIGLNNHLPVEEQASFKTEVGALEVDEANSVSIARVATLLNVDGYLRCSRSQRLKDDRSDAAESVNDGDKGKELKNYDRWRNAILGSARRHVTVKCGCDAMCHGGNRTVMSSGKGGECSREGGGARNGMLIHSESCVAPRNHGKMVGTHHTRSGVGGRGHAGRGSGKKRRQSVMETMHSPGNHENGLLRFYLTPVRTYSRNKSNMHGLRGSRSTARSVSRFY